MNLEFKLFWSAFPNRVAKKAAEKAFANALKEASLDEIMAGVENYKLNKPPSQAWLHPATFLNGERFRDEYAPIIEQKINPTIQAIHDKSELDRIEKRLDRLRGMRPLRPGDKPAIEFDALIKRRKQLLSLLNFSV